MPGRAGGIRPGVQTFLPFPDFLASARVLDDRRLGKQRVEALQVLRALIRHPYGWQRHPAVRMWRGYEEALGAYALAICAEWVGRGHADTVVASLLADLAAAGLPTPRTQDELTPGVELPPWLGDERVHASHRSALLRKAPEWYASRLPPEPVELGYYWPVPL